MKLVLRTPLHHALLLATALALLAMGNGWAALSADDLLEPDKAFRVSTRGLDERELESVRQSKSVWCSKDRSKAWNDLMLRDIQPTAPTDCPDPIEKLVALGKELGAATTPTWFLPNGEKHQGALPISKVVPMLDATAKRTK